MGRSVTQPDRRRSPRMHDRPSRSSIAIVVAIYASAIGGAVLYLLP